MGDTQYHSLDPKREGGLSDGLGHLALVGGYGGDLEEHSTGEQIHWRGGAEGKCDNSMHRRALVPGHPSEHLSANNASSEPDAKQDLRQGAALNGAPWPHCSSSQASCISVIYKHIRQPAWFCTSLVNQKTWICNFVSLYEEVLSSKSVISL